MIDPKFNALPTDAEGDFEHAPEEAVSGEPGTGRIRRPRQGLSINDTIAAGPDLSVGSRGVDTSGTSAGAGAGAGTTYLTPDDDGSPAPNIISGARSSGTTARADSTSGQKPTTRVDAGTEGGESASAGADPYSFTREEISARAYQCWHERGRPHGSPETDWERAIQHLREEKERERRSSASA